MNFNYDYMKFYMGQLSPEENCPQDRVGVWVKVRVYFRVGSRPENSPLVRVRGSATVSFGVRGKISSGAIVLEPILVSLFPKIKRLHQCVKSY